MRVVTINLWGTEAPLEERLTNLEHQLRAIDPDAIGIQEARAETAQRLGDRLGMHVTFAAATGDEGLAVLSKIAGPSTHLELPEARPNDRRILLSIDLGEAWFHTTHLHYRLDDGLAREAQVLAIDAAIRPLRDKPNLLVGDFNCTDDCDEMRFLRGLTTLGGRRTHWQDAWLRARPGEPGWTWSSANPYTERLRRLDLDRRIDYVMVSSRRSDDLCTIERCELAFDDELVSDHYGVVTEVRTR